MSVDELTVELNVAVEGTETMDLAVDPVLDERSIAAVKKFNVPSI
jgi:hypothetical protein